MNKSSFKPLKVLIRAVTLGAAFAAILAIFSTVAVATPPEGIVSATVYATASFKDRTNVRVGIKDGGECREIVLARNAEDTVIQQIVIAPGGNSGWHLHPGPVVVLVKSGQLSYYTGDDSTCTARRYSAGQAFVEGGKGHVALARNEGSTNLEVWVTYFDVPPGGAFRIDAPDPGNCIF